MVDDPAARVIHVRQAGDDLWSVWAGADLLALVESAAAAFEAARLACAKSDPPAPMHVSSGPTARQAARELLARVALGGSPGAAERPAAAACCR